MTQQRKSQKAKSNNKKASIFIDESGVHSLTGHSVIVLVYIYVKDLEKLERSIEKIEKELGINYFHWADFGSKRGWKIREEFMRKISQLEFTCKVAIIKNPIRLPAVLEYSLAHLVYEKYIQKIVIDGKKPKWYSLRLKKVLRDKGVSVKKINTANDESSPGLRLADAIAGLVRSYQDKPGIQAEKLYKLIENKITAQLVGGQKAR